MCYYEGEGHSGSIIKAKISPDQKTIVSVGSEGAIFFWSMPQDVVCDVVEPELPTLTTKKENDKASSVKGSVKSSVKGPARK